MWDRESIQLTPTNKFDSTQIITKIRMHGSNINLINWIELIYHYANI